MQIDAQQTHDRTSPQGSGKGPAVVFTVDEKFVLPLAVALYSMLTNLRGVESIDVFILHPSFSEDNKNRLRRVVEQADTSVELSFIEVNVEEQFGDLDLQFNNRFTEMIYVRLLIGSLLPSGYKKVIYLDSDIVVEDNVMELWSSDLEGQVLMACQERTVSCSDFGIHRWEELGLDPDDPYFNSGVMVIDLEKWRALDIGSRVLDYLQQYGKSLNVRGNQEGFNAVLAGHWKQLPYRWNVLHYYYDPSLFDRFGQPVPSDAELSEITRNPSIIHYTDGPKPWQPGCTHPRRDRFYEYLRESGWFSPTGYLAWRAALTLQNGIHTVKEVTRPFRHRIGLHR